MASLIAPEEFSAVADAEALKKAFHGWGTNEKGVIAILGHRNAAQRKMIWKAYEEKYQENFIKRLESELSGHFEKAVYRWVLDPADRDAVLVNLAIKKVPDPRVIVEMSCVKAPEDLLIVKRAYQIRYKRSMEEDIASHTSGDMRKFLVALVGVHRYDGGEIDTKLAKSEADILNKAIKENLLTHEEIIRIITTRSKAQLMATRNHYKDAHGISLSKHLAENPANEFLSALLTAIKCLTEPKRYYEKVLRTAIKQKGTDEDALTRVIVTRAEVDLEEIKDLYYKRNSVTLENAVAKETSGHYKAFLLTLLGKQD
ncbi:hypothetical protein DCAR_0103440 [Daucus carota subsp. sativus]|uniref:Annexin n=1 Tax=Daucus carota subsp. sativus TaxID=79200 RepID=A0A162ALD9_DAUCS|nr:PREDICTED: annexin-like protein RJ4 [Daucus carota subsp. sativus]WOG84258.1 hypothetical protein DCAR_0103440 [Daucus carota subsp. sativus]